MKVTENLLISEMTVDLFMNKKRNCVEIVLYKKKKIINLFYKRVT